jgi:hypothetical protein
MVDHQMVLCANRMQSEATRLACACIQKGGGQLPSKWQTPRFFQHVVPMSQSLARSRKRMHKENLMFGKPLRCLPSEAAHERYTALSRTFNAQKVLQSIGAMVELFNLHICTSKERSRPASLTTRCLTEPCDQRQHGEQPDTHAQEMQHARQTEGPSFSLSPLLHFQPLRL